MMRRIMPGWARWSTPGVPNMSPAAIGCTVVRRAGAPSARNRAPRAFSTASGQSSPEEALTATVAPSGTIRAASAAVLIFAMAHPPAVCFK